MQTDKQKQCVHKYKHNMNFAYGGKWYERNMCSKCYDVKDRYIRDVDHSSKLDCAAADASQGIV